MYKIKNFFSFLKELITYVVFVTEMKRKEITNEELINQIIKNKRITT